MVTSIRSLVTMPGKVFEYLSLAKEIQGIAKRATGAEIVLVTAVGGDPSTVGYIAQWGSLGDFEGGMAKLMADADYRAAVKKSEHLIVPGSVRDQIWRHA